MKVAEALSIIQRAPREEAPYSALLALGSTPLHLQTFFQARLQQQLPKRHVQVTTGLYGDLCGTIETVAAQEGIAIVVEWSDLDPRLGYRSTAKWPADLAVQVVRGVAAALDRLATAISRLPPEIRVAVSLPSLPRPPLFHTPGGQASPQELELFKLIADFAARIATRPGLGLVQPNRLDELSPLASRFDLKSELLIGFPYTQAHASALASCLASLLAPPAPKKGIITDLDDTLWSGIVGDVGAQGVSWDFSRHHHLHALYQNLLGSLATQGVLIGVASKNDAGVVQEVFEREDMLLGANQVFPMEVHWQAKSGSVDHILKTWNIAADSVIFIDDSPMELAEVAAAHPGIQCLQFPRGDHAQGLQLLLQLRDLCGRATLSSEDAIRLESIRSGAKFQDLVERGSASEEFLQSLDAAVTIQFSPPMEDTRVLELVNKTNQFNLNGKRRTEADWHRENQKSGSVVAVVSYQDKFGPLGKIAVFQGLREQNSLTLDTWVMSCRAFSRRVEYQCLQILFERFQLTEIHLAFDPTSKNGPTKEFLRGLTGSDPVGAVTIERSAFRDSCPALFHAVTTQGL